MKYLLLLLLLIPSLSFSQEETTLKELELRVKILEERNDKIRLHTDVFLDVHNGGLLFMGIGAVGSTVNAFMDKPNEAVYITSGLIGILGLTCVAIAPNYIRRGWQR